MEDPRVWTARFEVRSGEDPLRQERLTRALSTELNAVDGVEVQFITPTDVRSGSKGTVETAALLLAATAPLARPTAEAVKAVLTGWLARDRRTVVRATVGDRTLEIIGDPSPTQQEALDSLLFSGQAQAADHS